MLFSEKPLFDMTDEEIKQQLRANAPHVVQSWNDLMRELDRRAAESNAGALRVMTALLVGSTIVYTLATLALVIVTWLKG
jgi:hypothetical protein